MIYAHFLCFRLQRLELMGQKFFLLLHFPFHGLVSLIQYHLVIIMLIKIFLCPVRYYSLCRARSSAESNTMDLCNILYGIRRLV